MRKIRNALHTDALPLAQFAERTFRDTFANENTREDMDLHCRTAYSESLQGDEIAQPDMTTLLCEDEGILAGYAQVRWHSVSPSVIAQTPGEIHRFYVDRAWHGRGIAQALMEKSLAEFATHGCDAVWLGVWEHNPKAIAFYTKYNFVAVGEHTFVLGGDPQRDIIMARPL